MNSKSWFIFPRPEKGSVLIITMWTLLFLSFFCVTLASVVSTKINTALRIKNRAVAYYIAKAGIFAGMEVVAQDDTDYDFYGDNWCGNNGFFGEVEVGQGFFNVTYDYADSEYYGLIDEERKLNLNTASQDSLSALFTLAGYPAAQANQLADCIIDWRDTDSNPQPYGAEDDYYGYLEIPYVSKDADFESLEELLLIKGMDSEIFSAVKDDLTIFTQGAVNINTAGKNVLIALGMTEDLADKVINYRLAMGQAVVAEEIPVFENINEIGEKIELTEEETAIINTLASSALITASSNNFKVESGSVLDKTGTAGRITCVFDREGEIKYWQRD